MINDAEIRHIVTQAIPAIDPRRLEVCLMDYDATVGFWYRTPEKTLYGRAIAINRSEHEIASDLARDLLAQLTFGEDPAPLASPYEGKPGRHPDTCTCSKHKAVDGQAQ